MESLKKNNEGVTLIELIITIAIFSILAMILLRAFVTSSRINRKSNTYLEATSLAQNIVEEAKGKTFEGTALAFNYPINQQTGTCRFSFLDGQLNRIGNELTIGEVIPSTRDGQTTYRPAILYENASGNVKMVNASILSMDKGNTYTFQKKTGELASKYYFTMKGVNGEKESFDVLTEFDGSSNSGYKKASARDNNEKNDYEMPNIAQLDTKSNGFLIMEKEWDKEAMKTMVSKQHERANSEYNARTYGEAPAPNELDQAEVYENTKRILQIKVVEENGVITAKARYTLHAYQYSHGGNPYESMSICPCGGKNLGKDMSDPTWNHECFCTYVSAYTTFYSSEAGENLKGIYVFYYPNYNSTSSVKPLDEIEIDNRENIKFDLYISKQRDTDLDSTKAIYNQKEGAYRMGLTIEETPSKNNNSNWNTNLNMYRAQIRFRSNLNQNISEEDASRRTHVNQMKLVYKEKLDSGAIKSASGNSAQMILAFNTMDVREKYDRIYTMKVSVYKAGAAERNFPAEDLIVQLDGSKEN